MAQVKTGKSKSVRPAKRKVPDSNSIIEEEFGNYRIRAGRLNGNFVARAFPKSQSNSQGLMAEAPGTSETEAIEALKILLETRETRRFAARRWEERSEILVPSKDEFIEALRQTNLSTTQIAMLKAHAITGENGIMPVALMKAAGYKSRETATKTLARAGGLIAHFLGVVISAGENETQGDPRRMIGFSLVEGEDSQSAWIMHEELRHAVWATL